MPKANEETNKVKHMEYRQLGKSGLQVSALSLGSWITFAKQADESQAERLMDIAYENGVNFFDNAEVYARGESEILMGRILRKKGWERSSYLVSSKAFFGWHGGKNNKPNQKGLSRKHLVEACHEALKRFQLDYLDLYFCHRPDPTVPMEEIVWTMNHLISQGKILYWGTSEWSAAEIMDAHRVAAEYRLIGPVMEQPEYNLFERRKMEQEYIPVFRTHGMGTTIWSPLASGFLTGKYNEGIPSDSRLALEGFDWLRDRVLVKERVDSVRRLAALAEELGTRLPQLALAWCLTNPHVSTAIMGASRPGQLEENLKALDLVPLLNQEVLDRIDQIVGTRP